ncbi:MAG TPA: outer membrane protein assembly factor BamA [Terriglobales bacterium]|nr:outer membrane protein assembly factor BamA [Terriglobales bacterium]
MAGTALRWAVAVLLLTGMTLAQGPVIEEILIHGNRRIPAETIRARIFSRAGDVYDEGALQRDFRSLWNTGFFADLRIEREESPRGYRIHVYVQEKPNIREINYVGLSSVQQSDVLERFRKNKVGLTLESQYDPTKVKKAEVTLKELLAEHGRQFATVRTEVRPIPPNSVGVSFILKEGPKVKVGKIRFEGNKNVSSRVLQRAMVNLKPIGIPRSIFLENLFSKTFDASKLAEDAERVRYAYQQRGYFKAIVSDPRTETRDSGGFRIPLFMKGGGKAVDITIPIEEGQRYHLAGITFKNNKAIQDTRVLRAAFAMKDGDIFNAELVRKGLDALRELHGELGYVNFTAVPDTKFDDEKRLITLEIDIDEGKPFYVRRIEFQGNTTTRDKVIRRELALEEGNVYNSRLWKLSLLRLNQLGYFEQLDPEQDASVHQNVQEGTVDITLKVKERGKNSIGLQGGVSGLEGGFIGLSYETNNFLGLGETLRVEGSTGNRGYNILFGFTEPYLFDRPLQFGFTVFAREFRFNQADQFTLATGQEIPESAQQFLLNYNQNTKGFTVSGSYPLRRSFKRLGLTYAFDTSSVSVFSDASRNLFEQIAFRGLSGPQALEGIVTSKVIPSFSVNRIDNPYRPSRGYSLFLGGQVAGLGGNVKLIRPIAEYKYFRPHKRNVIGMRLQGSFLTGYGGQVAPPYERFYVGGDTDLRGFDIRSVTPIGFLVGRENIPLLNPDRTPVPLDPTNPRRGNYIVPIPIHRIVFTGGDTTFVSNVEYRIPIVGPVTVALFNDFGMNFVARPSQLQINPSTVTDLNTNPFGCPSLTGSFQCAGGSTLAFDSHVDIVDGTNFTPRMSTGVEFQVVLPVVNAPMRIYYAYNPLRLTASTVSPDSCTTSSGASINCISRDMFPPGGAGDFTYQETLRLFAPGFRFAEPKTTFRFTVSTTF